MLWEWKISGFEAFLERTKLAKLKKTEVNILEHLQKK